VPETADQQEKPVEYQEDFGSYGASSNNYKETDYDAAPPEEGLFRPEQEEEKDNTMLYVAAGGLAVAALMLSQ
jgi:hypothetical protein